MRISNFELLRDAAGAGDGGGGTGGKGLRGAAAAGVDEKVASFVNETINGALAKFKTDLPTSVKGIIDAAIAPFSDNMTKITENLTSLQSVLTSGGKGSGSGTGDGSGSGTGQGAGAGDDAIPPAVRLQMKRQDDAIKALTGTIETEKAARQKAEQDARATRKESLIRGELDKFEFTTPEAKEDAYVLVSGKIDFNEDGSSLIAEGLPVGDYLGEYLPSKKSHLLAPLGKAGAGASAGSQRASTGFRMEDIKPGMSQDELAKAAGAISRAIRTGA